MSEETVRGIFSVNGIKNTNQVRIKHLDNVKLKKQEFVPDELIERYEIVKDVFGEIYKCNITDVYLMSSKTLPIMYVSVIHEQPLRRFLLFRVYFQFEITKEIKDIKDLLDNPIDGVFELEIDLENKRKKLEDTITSFTGNEKIISKLTEFTKVDEMKELINNLLEEIRERLREQYDDYFDAYAPPKNVISLKNYKISKN